MAVLEQSRREGKLFPTFVLSFYALFQISFWVSKNWVNVKLSVNMMVTCCLKGKRDLLSGDLVIITAGFLVKMKTCSSWND